jgi:tetratricopeptide (TPR) repeat protein
MAFVKQERYPEALAQFDESTDINRAHGFGSGVIFNQMNRASVLLQLGRYSEAQSSLTEASTLAKSKSLKAVIAEIPMIQAQIAQSNRQFSLARKYSEEAIELAGSTYPDVALGAKITLGSAQAFSGATAEGKRNCEEALAMAKKSGEEALISDAMLALAGALYEHGDFDQALTYALNVQERLARSGEQESEWRAWLIAAQCSIRMNDREQARQRLKRANDSLSTLQQHWGAEAFDRYQKRPDIQFTRKQLSEALFAVP